MDPKNIKKTGSGIPTILLTTTYSIQKKHDGRNNKQKLIIFREIRFVSGSRPGIKIDAMKAAITIIGTGAENTSLHSN